MNLEFTAVVELVGEPAAPKPRVLPLDLIIEG
jgi:hypothetical protein